MYNPPPPRGFAITRPSAWGLLAAAPLQYTVAALLLFLVSSSIPIVGTILAGPLWVGLCAMAQSGMRGETPKIETLFAPFGDKRLQPSLVLGVAMTVIQLIGIFAGAAVMFASFFTFASAWSNLDPASVPVGLISGLFALSLLLMLLPFVLMAYFMLPAAYYIVHGETDSLLALRRTWRMVSARPGHWSGFWGKMALGHLVGFCCCCVGIFPALAWNAIALMQAVEAVEARETPPQ